MPAALSIIPSMPMLTTPERSHHRPAMAPRAMGVPSRSDSTSSWMMLVSFASDNASDRTTTSGASNNADDEQAAPGVGLGALAPSRR